MSRWWRAYDEALNDPKLQILGLEMIGAWFNLMCLASKNKGIIKVQDVPFALRISKSRAAIIITRLATAGLLDRAGDDYAPHNWAGRQYQSDGSTERVKRHRDKRVAVGLERQWTAPKELRQTVYERDGFKCVYCGSEEKLSLDHRTPEIRGGTHVIENLATACMSCNGAKRDLTEEEFRSRNGLSNDDETLLKRPQTTDYREQISEVSTSAPAALEPDLVDVVDEEPRARLFRLGKPILISFGISEKRTGALIGQWLKAKPDALGLLAVLQFTRDQNVAEPVAYVSAIIHGKQKNGAVNEFDRRPGESLGDLASRMAEAAREFERTAGDRRSDDDFGRH